MKVQLLSPSLVITRKTLALCSKHSARQTSARVVTARLPNHTPEIRKKRLHDPSVPTWLIRFISSATTFRTFVSTLIAERVVSRKVSSFMTNSSWMKTGAEESPSLLLSSQSEIATNLLPHLSVQIVGGPESPYKLAQNDFLPTLRFGLENLGDRLINFR